MNDLQTLAPHQARPVSILHYAGPPYVGGVEITIAAHSRLLASHDIPVRIIAGKGSPIGPGIDLQVIPELHSRGERIEQIASELAEGVLSDDFHRLVAELTERLGAALADTPVVMAHNILSLHKNLPFTAALRRLHDDGKIGALLAWCHDFAWLDPLYIPELRQGYPWDLLRRPWPNVRYVAVSQDRRHMLANLFGLSTSVVSVVTPGIDLQAFLKLEAETMRLVESLGLLDAEPLLLLPARVTRRKNIELGVAITAALGDLGLRPRLVITGPPGPHNPTNAAYLRELLNLRRTLGADDKVVFLYEVFTDEVGRPRPVTDALMADLYRLADGLLFPSRYEGFGIPVLEAGLAGVPIFCSDLPPLQTMAGTAAHYFHVDEPPALIAQCIAKALADDPRAALKRRVRTDFTWEAIFRHEIAPLLVAGQAANL